MKHPLDGPRLKVRRAKEEIQRLREAQQAFQVDAGYRIVRAETNPHTGNHVYRVRVGRPVPPEWGVWIGEIAHNLRSALDGLVHQLALLNLPTGRAPRGITQFPIFLVGRPERRVPGKSDRIPHFIAMKTKNGKQEGARNIGQVQIADLRQDHQAIIEQLQPYKRGRGDRKSPLFWLKELNNTDKHCLLLVVGAAPGSITLSTWGGDDSMPGNVRSFTILEDGAEIADAPDGVIVSPRITPFVGFGAGCPDVKNRFVCGTLDRIANEVTEIVEGFASELSQV